MLVRRRSSPAPAGRSENLRCRGDLATRNHHERGTAWAHPSIRDTGPDGRRLRVGAPWVSWQQGHRATVCYLHGALHLFDAGSEITKYTWSKTDRPIVEQIRAALDEEKYPVPVANQIRRY
jgi:hypothetical protein